jgi:membrane associated rhomboid family serine protease
VLPVGVVGKSKYQPYVVYALIAINMVVFIWELYVQSLGQNAFIGALRAYALNVCEVGVEPLPGLALDSLRSMFLHGDLLHLFGNMLFLWVFGGKVEEYFGRVPFLVFYLIVGHAAALGHVLFGGVVCLTSGSTAGLVIGASGAIAGVMGAFLFLHPGARVRTLIGLFRPFFWEMKLPAILFLGYWFILDVLKGIGWISSLGVAHWAHIGGFVAGFALVFVATLFWRPAPQADPFAYLDE